MKPRLTDLAPLFLILVLIIALLSGPETTVTADQGSTTPAATTQERIPPCAAQGSPPVWSAAEPEAVAPETAEGQKTEEAVDFRAMKRRYGRDATGVRARLGMCRKGGNGQNGGPHRHFRGGERWNTP